MAIDRQSGALWRVTCDDCGETLDIEPQASSYFEAQAMRARNWRTFRRDNAWCHACPACVEAFASGDDKQGSLL